MTTTGNVIVVGNVTGGPSGARTFGPTTILLPNAVDETVVVTLVVGANTITVPMGTTVAVFLPPNSANPMPNPPYGGVLTVKGVSGDTGVPISSKYPSMLAWDTAPATLVVNATAVGTLEVWFA